MRIKMYKCIYFVNIFKKNVPYIIIYIIFSILYKYYLVFLDKLCVVVYFIIIFIFILLIIS